MTPSVAPKTNLEAISRAAGPRGPWSRDRPVDSFLAGLVGRWEVTDGSQSPPTVGRKPFLAQS